MIEKIKKSFRVKTIDLGNGTVVNIEGNDGRNPRYGIKLDNKNDFKNGIAYFFLKEVVRIKNAKSS